MRCEGCGFESADESHFKSIARFVTISRKTLCTHCQHEAEHKIQMRLSILCLFLLSIQFAYAKIGSSLPPILLAWILLYPLQLAGLVAHECGHLVGAMLARFEVFHVNIGAGKALLNFETTKIHITVRRAPIIGYVIAAARFPRAWRFRALMFTLGGPVVNLLLLLVCLARVWRVSWLPAQWTTTTAMWFSFGVANAVLLVSAIIPRALTTPFGPMVTDGMSVWRLLRNKVPSPEKQREAYDILHGVYLARCKRFEEAKLIFVEALQGSPDNLSLIILLANVEMSLRRFDVAAERLSGALQRTQISDELRPIFLNCLAWAELMTRTPAMLSLADKHSAEAIAIAPWQPAIKSTRGAVMTSKGDYAAAVPLLHYALKRAETSYSRASVACFLALAEHQAGEADRSRKWLRRAERWDETCEALDYVREHLTDAPAFAQADALI